MKRLSCTITMAFVCAFIVAQTQQGYVKTKGRMVNGQHVKGQGLTGAVVELYGRTAVGVRNADGSFSFPVVGKSFTVQSVMKKGYQLVDADAAPKAYAYSGNPFYLVMEPPEQQQADQVAAERKLRRTLQQQLQKREDEIDAMNATIEEKNRLLAELYESQQNNEKLIADMAKEYAAMDYDQMDSLNQCISDAILNGRLMEADSLLRSKGDMRDRIAVIRREQQAEAQREEEIANEQRELAATKAGTQKKLEDAASDCYKFFDRFKLENQHDSAAYYIELRAELDTANTEWQFDAANYLLRQNQSDKAETYLLRLLCDISRQSDDIIFLGMKASVLNNIGILYEQIRQAGKSEACYLQALQIRNQLALLDTVYAPVVAQSQGNLAQYYATEGRTVEAHQMFTKAIAALQGIAEQQPQYSSTLASIKSNFALLLLSQGSTDHSEQLFIEALSTYRQLADKDSISYMPNLAATLSNLALLYFYDKRLLESRPCYQEAIAIYIQLEKNNPQAYQPYADSLAVNLRRIAVDLNNTAYAYEKDGSPYLATPLYNESLSIYYALHARLADDYNSLIARELGNLSFNAILCSDFPLAEEYARKGLAADSSKLFIYANLVEALLLQGKVEEGLETLAIHRNEIEKYLIEDFEQLSLRHIIPKEQASAIEKILK